MWIITYYSDTEFQQIDLFPPHHQAILQHQLCGLQVNSPLTLSVQRQQKFLQVMVSVPQHCLPPNFSCLSQVQVVTYASNQLAVNQRFPGLPPWVQLVC